MKITRTPFDGLIILEPAVYKDDRGYFTEVYNYAQLKKLGIDIHFVQDNQSFSLAGVIRGLHFQNAPKAQTKLVRVLQGTILDVVVDLRKEQPTFKKIHTLELSRENGKQLIVPKGFAHGFSVLTASTDVIYKIDEVYSPEHESGIRFDDPELEIDWKVDPKKMVISSKDQLLPFLKNEKFTF